MDAHKHTPSESVARSARVRRAFSASVIGTLHVLIADIPLPCLRHGTSTARRPASHHLLSPSLVSPPQREPLHSSHLLRCGCCTTVAASGAQ